MTPISPDSLQNLMKVLEAVPDINDALIRNKTLCAYTNSRDFIYIDFGNSVGAAGDANQALDIPATMTLVDFGLKSKTLKVLSEGYQLPVSHREDGNKITFVFGNGSGGQIFESNIPIINNHHKQEDFDAIFNSSELVELFNIDIPTATMQKLKSVIDLYKASASIVREEAADGTVGLAIRVQSSSKTDDYKTALADRDLFADNAINLSQPLKLQRFLFDYNFGGDTINMKFYSLGDKIVIDVHGTLEGRNVRYVHRATIEKSLDEIVNISQNTIDLQLGI